MLLTPAGDSPFGVKHGSHNNNHTININLSSSSVVSAPISATSTIQSRFVFNVDFFNRF